MKDLWPELFGIPLPKSIMNTDQLFKILSEIHPLSHECKEAFLREVKSVKFPRGHYLVQAQTPAHHAYFLEKGFAVSYRYQRNKRVVTDFWESGQIILSPKSFFEQWASDEIIQLTTDGELLSVSYRSVVSLIEKFPVANALARDITADYYAKSEEHIVDLHTLDAWQRYLKVLDTYAGIEKHVSQELIASYLNITPQSLSRLKAEHS
jgi:CRP/FNR family transcriptional regulator, anaerobic regulatory protein